MNTPRQMTVVSWFALCKDGELKADPLREMPAGKRVVLVIDNYEHVARETSSA